MKSYTAGQLLFPNVIIPLCGIFTNCKISIYQVPAPRVYENNSPFIGFSDTRTSPPTFISPSPGILIQRSIINELTTTKYVNCVVAISDWYIPKDIGNIGNIMEVIYGLINDHQAVAAWRTPCYLVIVLGSWFTYLSVLFTFCTLYCSRSAYSCNSLAAKMTTT